VRCPRCGNENPESHRFCGMCGTSLLAGSEIQASPGISSSESASRGTAVLPQPPPRVEASVNTPAQPVSPRPSRVASSAENPIIAGPSFLGLNKPGPAERVSRGNSIYALDQAPGKSSRNLDYLLEDEEEPKRGASKALLILLALLLCVGFGYLRWKTGGFSWLTSEIKAAVHPAAPPGTPTQTDSSSPAGTVPSGTDPSTAPPSASPSGDTSSPPAGQGTGTTPNSDNSSAVPAGSSNSSSNNSAPGTSAPGNSPPAGSAGASATQPAAGDPSSGSPAATPSPPATKSPDAESKAPESNETASADSSATRPDSKTEAPAVRTRPGTPARPSPAVPGSKPTPAIPPDSVVIDAEKYIYGRGGVAQDCDRGLKMLRTSAYQSNEKAMISLGALYTTGLCAPRDLPTAYRWFAVALRKEPDNPALQQNLQKLWSQMTQPERQLAMKLSQ
jgi:zinc ribbon protein